jgi:hypothetical protein
MARLRYRAMYATSTVIGCVLWWVLATLDGSPVAGARALIRQAARKHAIEAARKRGPYLAPVTFLAVLVGVVALGALLVDWLSS